MKDPAPVKTTTFLKDVLICSLGAYGGPEAHIGVFQDQMVTKKRYLEEEELIELVALCSILPGPTSTQTLVAVGYKTGGPLLALLTMLVWALPVLILMTALSFLYDFLAWQKVPLESLRYIGPMAVAFILLAAYKIGRKVITDRLTLVLTLLSALVTYFIRSPWIFPLLLLAGGAVSVAASKEKHLWERADLHPPWRFLAAFFSIALLSLLATLWIDDTLVHLFESFYRYGYLVFGGGQVVVPLMYTEMVSLREYVSHPEFLTGYGLVQGLPGPMFSFSAYIGGMAARGTPVPYQVTAAFLSGLGIFLPGLLLIYFIYPVWEGLKKIRGIRLSLKGINAVAGGMIAVAALVLFEKTGFGPDNLVVTGLTLLLLLSRKIPAPVIVALVLLGGYFL